MAQFDSRQGGYQIVFPPFPPVIKGLIITNTVIYILQTIAGREAIEGMIHPLLALDPEKVIYHFWIWQPLTYQFLHHHADIWHLLMNMLMLWFFGADLARRWGSYQFLKFYLICGYGAGIIACAVNIMMGVSAVTIGASGAIFGVLMAFGMVYPNKTVFFLLFPVPARVLVMIFAFVQLWSAGAFRSGGVAYFAHIGGMLVAWIYLTGRWNPKALLAEIRWKMRRRKFRAMQDINAPPDDDPYTFH
jgi:membrane associated rhomboid family serine protease